MLVASESNSPHAQGTGRDDLSMSSDEAAGEFVTLAPSGKVSRELCRRAVAEFGRDGAWLVLSQLWYGWRVYYDLALGLATGVRPAASDDARPYPLDDDYRVAVDLQVRGFVFAAAEQFCTMVRAARAHQGGTDAFLRTYVEGRRLGELIESVEDLSVDEVTHLIGLPTSAEQLLAERDDLQLEEVAGPGTTVLDPVALPTVDVGGLHVPRSAIDRGAAERLVEQAREVVELIVRNAQEVKQLVERPTVAAGIEDGVTTQPLREIDNSFRHGLRILFHDAVPEPRMFRSASGTWPRGHDLVDLYLPRGGEQMIRFSTLDCSPERTVEHLEVVRELCTRTGQFVRGFVGWHALQRRGLLAAAATLELPEPPSAAALSA